MMERTSKPMFGRQSSSIEPSSAAISQMGLLQIAKPGLSTSGGSVHLPKSYARDSPVALTSIYKTSSSTSGILSLISTSGGNIPGIPTPSLSGVLTGIKPPPLFSLPGVRPDADSSKLRGQTQSIYCQTQVVYCQTQPIYSASKMEPMYS